MNLEVECELLSEGIELIKQFGCDGRAQIYLVLHKS